MNAKRIFTALTLIVMVVIQAATARAQSNTRGAVLPQIEELKISIVEETCRPYLSQPQAPSECQKSKASQLKGTWLITFTPRFEDGAAQFTSLAAFTLD